MAIRISFVNNDAHVPPKETSRRIFRAAAAMQRGAEMKIEQRYLVTGIGPAWAQRDWRDMEQEWARWEAAR
jgi:hypothetical protein